MLADIEPRQFEEWIAAYQLDPWGDDWKQTAMLAAYIHNAACPSSPVEPAELIPNIDNKKSDEVPDSQLAARWRTRLGVGG